MNLESLEEFNTRESGRYRKESNGNGLKCPECGEELLDSRPGGILLSSPPQVSVHCKTCNWTGHRIAIQGDYNNGY